MNGPTRAFTLIELLVVVTIIIVLLALLTPALDKAVEAAERAKCGANLDAWGIVHATYYVDQRRRILSTMRTSSQYPNPNFCWGRSDLAVNSGGTRDADFSAKAMKPYVPSTDLSTYAIKGIWACPSNRAPLKDEVANRTGNGTGGAVATSGYFQPDYAYFAHQESWPGHATKPELLTGRSLQPGKLLMADTIWRWRVNKTWWFNHGQDGWSVHDAAWGGPVTGPGTPKITGANQLFGDGSVDWKDGKEFNPELMEKIDTSEPWVSHQTDNGKPDPTGDITYY